MSEKTLINEMKNVAGHAKDNIQEIQNFFYPVENEMPKKAVVYFRWKDRDTEEPRTYQSTYFSCSKQLEEFIYKLAELLGYFMKKKDKFGSNWKIQTGRIANKVKENVEKGMKEANNGGSN